MAAQDPKGVFHSSFLGLFTGILATLGEKVAQTNFHQVTALALRSSENMGANRILYTFIKSMSV